MPTPRETLHTAAIGLPYVLLVLVLLTWNLGESVAEQPRAAPCSCAPGRAAAERAVTAAGSDAADDGDAATSGPKPVRHAAVAYGASPTSPANRAPSKTPVRRSPSTVGAVRAGSRLSSSSEPPRDCVAHLTHIRGKRQRGSESCLAEFDGIIRHELSTIKSKPALRWRRHHIDHGARYPSVIRCLGLAEDWSSVEQRDPRQWEKRAAGATQWVVLSNSTRAVRAASRVPENDPPSSIAEAVESAGGADKVVAPESHPLLHPLHGGVPPARLVKHSRFLGRLLGVVDKADKLAAAKTASDAADTHVAIAELGAGNGGLLFPLCPPHPRVRCYGADYAKRLVEEGNGVFGFAKDTVRLTHACFLPQVPTGGVDAVISNAVMMYLKLDQACRHVAEALRILKPGGRAVFWMLKRLWQGTRYHWSFFANSTVWPDAGPPALGPDGTFGWKRAEPSFPVDVLSVCSSDLAQLVTSVEIFVDGPADAAIYPASRHSFFGVRVTRSDVPWPKGPSEAGDEREPAQPEPHEFDAQLLRRYRVLLDIASRMSA